MRVKTNLPGYVKDRKTGALINTNEEERMIYLRSVSQFLKNKEQETQLSNLRNEVEDLKNLIKNIHGTNNTRS